MAEDWALGVLEAFGGDGDFAPIVFAVDRAVSEIEAGVMGMVFGFGGFVFHGPGAGDGDALGDDGIEVGFFEFLGERADVVAGDFVIGVTDGDGAAAEVFDGDGGFFGGGGVGVVEVESGGLAGGEIEDEPTNELAIAGGFPLAGDGFAGVVDQFKWGGEAGGGDLFFGDEIAAVLIMLGDGELDWGGLDTSVQEGEECENNAEAAWEEFHRILSVEATGEAPVPRERWYPAVLFTQLSASRLPGGELVINRVEESTGDTAFFPVISASCQPLWIPGATEDYKILLD
jgi:hypothetical protein